MATIKSLQVIHEWKGEKTEPKDGFQKIDVDLCSGTFSRCNVYLCYSTTVGEDAITGLQVEASYKKDNGYCTPLGYTRVEGYLNKGAGGKYIYLSYTTNPEIGRPIVDIRVLADDFRYNWPEVPYTRINQDCNEGALGKYVYIAYKKSDEF